MLLEATPTWMIAAAKMKYGTIPRAIGGLIGKKCWKVTVSFGELALHLGTRLPYENPRMAGEKKGEWIFDTCGTGWTLLTPKGVVQPMDGSEERVEDKAKAIEGSKLIDFGITWPIGRVVLAFNDGSRLLVEPTSKDSKYDFPFWQLFTPEDRMVSFGPGPKLSFRKSDHSS